MRGFTLLELIVVLAITAVLGVITARWGGALRRGLAMREGVSSTVASLLLAQYRASESGGASLAANPARGSLLVVGADGATATIPLPKGIGFGFPPPGTTTGGSPVSEGDDGIHLDGRGNRRRFLADGLPEGSLSLAIYLVEKSPTVGEAPRGAAVTMSAPTGRIRAWKQSGGAGGAWVPDE